MEILWCTKLAGNSQHWPLTKHMNKPMGAIVVTEDPSALRRWMVAGPEVKRLVAEYDVAADAKDTTRSTMEPS